MVKVLYQGIPGSYSEKAALESLGSEHQFEGMVSFPSLYSQWEQAEECVAVLPVENTLIGSITENVDFLRGGNLLIEKEVTLRVEHQLLCRDECQNIESIKEVYSHPKALGQCEAFFKSYPWIEVKSYYDTAGAAKMVAESGKRECAAIASKECAELYGLKVLARSIQDNRENYTRFVVLRKEPLPLSYEGDKCALCVRLSHVPGALATLLSLVAAYGCNLTHIESRPIKSSPFEYDFHIDLEWKGVENKEKESLINKMKTLCSHCVILGVFSSLDLEERWIS